MLVAFIGSPCSGKTTTAAKLFAALKENGVPCEYIAERARAFIAGKRYALKHFEPTGGSLVLTDFDQMSIAMSQYRSEIEMNDDGLTVVTDSCVLNSLLYMSEKQRANDWTHNLAVRAAQKYDVLFICAPVPRPAGTDPNRVHDEAASNALHDQIETIVRPYVSEHTKVILLTGNSYERFNLAYSSTMEALTAQAVEKVAC